MRTFEYKKLVRDKIAADVIRNGGKIKYIVLGQKKYILELKKKLLEEAQELLKISSDNKILAELADTQEIIDNLLRSSGFSKHQLTLAQSEKNHSRGSFKKKHYIDSVQVPNDSEWVTYYLKHPKQYPEIKI